MLFRSLILSAIIAASTIAHARTINDSLTYQGYLVEDGLPADGLYDISFFVFDAEVGGVTPPNANVTVLNVEAVDGVFSAVVDFGVTGQIFDSTQTRWLEVRVTQAGHTHAASRRHQRSPVYTNPPQQ